MAIGARGGDYVGSFYGSIDELTIYNRALAAGEIQAIYNAGSTGKCVVVLPPTILVHPTNQAVVVGGTAVFEVQAAGTPPLSYQWWFNGTNLLLGATTATLTLMNVQLASAGNYSVVVANSAGTATSSNALLTVLSEPACITPPSGLVAFWRGTVTRWTGLERIMAFLLATRRLARDGSVRRLFSMAMETRLTWEIQQFCNCRILP